MYESEALVAYGHTFHNGKCRNPFENGLMNISQTQQLIPRKGRSRSPNFNTSCYTYTCCMVPLISLVKKIPMGFTPVITAHCLASSCTEPGLRTKVLAEIKTKDQKLKKKRKKKFFFFLGGSPPQPQDSLCTFSPSHACA